MRLMQRHLDKALEQHERIVKLYKRKYSKDKKDKRDWRTYEQRLAMRIKTASQELEPIVEEAYSMINIGTRRGKPPEVPLTKKIIILLLKDIFQLSNRRMANLLAMFTVLTGIELSYKTVERVYSDPLARMTIHNMFVLLVKKKGVKNPNTSGDGTGYSLTVTRHYRNEREKELKRKNKPEDKKKEKDAGKSKEKRKAFAYAFALMDLDTGMYIGFGSSMKSEQDAFESARVMAEDTVDSIISIRLDKLYSYQSITEKFGKDTKIYVIPKSNATIKGSREWKRIIRSFVEDQLSHLQQYYKRNNSESGFSTDKKLCGWKVWQRRWDRIDTAMICKGVWHNLMRLG